MTDADFLLWLKSSGALRCVLVEAVARVGVTETTHYLSSRNYVAADHTVHKAVITGGCEISERLSLTEGAGSMAFSDIELDNSSGALDTWLGYIWRNRAVRVYYGDVRWDRADFRLMFDGIIDDLQPRARNVLNIVIRDKLQRLSTPLSETKLGGSTANKDRLLPLCFGEVHNVEPLLTNPATLEYQVHAGAIEDIIEAREQGVPVSITKTVATGKFVLNQALRGSTVTCSVQGDKPSTYSNTVAGIVQRLVTGYGTEPFVSGDLDAANLAAFETAHPQPVGVYFSGTTEVLAACQELAGSVGAQVVMSATGLLRLVKLGAASGTPLQVTETTMLEGTLRVASRVPVKPAVRLGYCRNYTKQDSLQTGIPAEHKDLFKEEWLTVTSNDATVAGLYKISEEAVQEDTCLLVAADAQTEADRRRDLRKVPRTIYACEAYADLMLAELGNAATLTSSRYSLSGGEDGQIVFVAKDLLRNRVKLEVYV